jgi:hypothetical protein
MTRDDQAVFTQLVAEALGARPQDSQTPDSQTAVGLAYSFEREALADSVTGTAKYDLTPDSHALFGVYEAPREEDSAVNPAGLCMSLLVFRAEPQSDDALRCDLIPPTGNHVTLHGFWRGSGISFWSAGRDLMPTPLRGAQEQAAARLGTHLRYCSVDQGRWLQVVTHVIREGEYILFHRGIFQHGRILPPLPGTDSTRPPQPPDGGMSLNHPGDSTPGTEDVAALEAELTELQQALAAARAELESQEEDLGRAENDMLDLEVEEERLLAPAEGEDHAERPANDTRLREIHDQLHRRYAELVQLQGQVEDAASDVEDLEDETNDLEDRLDTRYAGWQDAVARRAEEIVSRAIDEGRLPREQVPGEGLLSEALLQRLSPEARQLYDTSRRVLHLNSTDQVFRGGDNSPVIGAMAKCCERVFADAFAARRPQLVADPAVSRLRDNFKRATIDIPEEDQRYKVDKGSLGRVLNQLPDNEQAWSGMRNCGIAILLFGTSYRVVAGEVIEIDNPLRLRGTEDERRALRVACYEFQRLRNGFVHHDLATWGDVQQAQPWFQQCLLGLLTCSSASNERSPGGPGRVSSDLGHATCPAGEGGTAPVGASSPRKGSPSPSSRLSDAARPGWCLPEAPSWPCPCARHWAAKACSPYWSGYHSASCCRQRTFNGAVKKPWL